ncbi:MULTISPECIES: hypothetical protein [unclassified Pseudomonas]|uniref:hypothetical protein n=1 Tax=unclassified Pseudomonas TaxID=196821 RepID=UPI0014736D80|nr:MULTISPECIES: hypothetical protein [unclassified Pseudomonas]MBS7557311.1 hypothetical protein [Pseudomonas sp. RC4D1]NMY69210.1 hypothetical protein [Pseudomonas sp. WS 5414]
MRVAAFCLLWITALPASAEPYAQLQLQGVPAHGALRANNGSFTVQVALVPDLQPQHRLRLLLDDQAYGTPSRGPELPLVNIDRGQHRLAVQVLDGERVLQQSAPITFTLLRAHRR